MIGPMDSCCRSRRAAGGPRLSTLVLGAAPLLLAVVAVPSARAETVNRIVATVDGQPVTSHQVDAFLRSAGAPDPGALGEADRRRAVEAVVDDLIVQMETRDAGLAPSATEIDAYIDEIKKRNKLSDEQLAQALEAQGMTVDRYREQVQRELTRSALVSKTLRGHVNVTPEEVEQYYKDHPDEFSTAESVKVLHLLFPFRSGMSVADAEMLVAEAERARARLASGEAFDDVARDAANGPAHAIGGDLGLMKRGQMIPALEEAAFTLKQGEVSAPIRGDGGIHLVVVTGRESAKEVPLDEVREKIKEKLYAKALEDRYNRWVKTDLRKGHEVLIK